MPWAGSNTCAILGSMSAAAEDPGFGRPLGLGPEQLGDEPVRRLQPSVIVAAWVPYSDGRHVKVVAFAGEWTSRAVRLRWIAHGRETFDVWVWASSVQRLPLPEPATDAGASTDAPAGGQSPQLARRPGLAVVRRQQAAAERTARSASSPTRSLPPGHGTPPVDRAGDGWSGW